MEVSGERWPSRIRPTGVLIPLLRCGPRRGGRSAWEIRDRAGKNQQVLITTLTKRMAEDLTDGGKRGAGALPALGDPLDRADRDHPGPA